MLSGPRERKVAVRGDLYTSAAVAATEGIVNRPLLFLPMSRQQQIQMWDFDIFACMIALTIIVVRKWGKEISLTSSQKSLVK